MRVGPGARIGPYEVREMIGAGGMGEVWLGHDSRLSRDAALKVLPQNIFGDRERLARFRREAQLLAQLNHPNIATIYGLHEEPGQPVCLAMEYVPGDSLDAVIRRCREREGAGAAFGARGEESKKQPPLAGARGSAPGQPIGLPIDDALDITTQICDALEHAHEHGIIHRDLKPANVKVTPEGRVKVLDFGLAKALRAEPQETATVDSNAPTVSVAASPTLPGVILGTAAYMSPEQAKGKPVDRRTDIWALGCVLFEMLTGRAAFEGESVPEILGAVMRAEPEWTLLPADTPPGIRALLRRCLQKDARHRLRDAADVEIQIQDALNAPPSQISAAAPASRQRLLLAGLACVAVAAITGIAVWSLRPASPNHAVTHVVLASPEASQFLLTTSAVSARPMVALSPNGNHLAYIARTGETNMAPGLHVRAMDTSVERLLVSGTPVDPFFSPDGQWIGYYSGDLLRKVSVNGGPESTIARVTDSRGSAWGPDEMIVFSPNPSDGLWKVSANGGEPTKLTSLETGSQSHRWPQFLPDGKSIIFTSVSGPTPDSYSILASRLGTAEQKLLIQGGSFARYVPSGHLIYYRGGTIMAVPFDSARLEVTGPAVAVVEGVMAGGLQHGAAEYATSNTGSLVYLSGDSRFTGFSLVWVDRKGQMEALPAPLREYASPRLSPDGKRALVLIGPDVWMYDIDRDTLTRLTFDGDNSFNAPAWTPDGKKFLFNSTKAGPINIFWKPADGSGPDERLTTGQNQTSLGSFSPDGKTLVFGQIDPSTNRDIWMMSIEDRKPQVVLQTPFNETTGRISPDGRWLAYLSDESGRYEVYVRPFPGPGGKWQISTEGGSELTWSPRGNEIFYRTGAAKEKMMVVEVQTLPVFSAGKPRLLFEGDYVGRTQGAFYSVSPDGQRFLMLKPQERPGGTATQVHLVLNWFEELKQKVPVK